MKTPLKLRKRVRAWYKKNREAALARQKAQRNNDETRARQAAYKRAYFKKNKLKTRAQQANWAIRCYGSVKRYYEHRRVLKKYGLSIDEFEKFKAKRKGKCDLCGFAGKRLYLDHCHVKGHNRGFLCMACNRYLIGVLENRKITVKMITKYLNGRLK